MIHKTVVSLIAVAVIGLVGLVAGASARSPQSVAYKHCSAYAEEHFHDRNVNTPGGVNCVGAGEYCWPLPATRRHITERASIAIPKAGSNTTELQAESAPAAARIAAWAAATRATGTR